MPTNKICLDGTDYEDLNRFLFYFKNVTKVRTFREKQAKALISYLRGKEFTFYYKTLAINGELSKEGRNYALVKKVLRDELGKRKDL